jgi:hypothetical protein
MSYRLMQCHIQVSTAKRLRLLLRLYPMQSNDEGGVSARSASIDELIDKLLNVVVKEKYPAVFDLEKALAKTEKDFIANIINVIEQ